MYKIGEYILTTYPVYFETSAVSKKNTHFPEGLLEERTMRKWRKRFVFVDATNKEFTPWKIRNPQSRGKPLRSVAAGWYL